MIANPSEFPLLMPLILWSSVTIILYIFVKRLHMRWQKWWTAPLILTPLLLIAITLLSHTSYADYIRGTHWLVLLLGPATVSFAVPIYDKRQMIRRHWLILTIGVIIGSVTSMVSAWVLASSLGIHNDLRLSLMPRSITTPFAMMVSSEIGGIPGLTALFVIITGLFGASFGEALLYWLPLKSTLARGAMFGMGAHIIGTNKAFTLNQDEGSIAGVVMVLVGVVNVLAAPLLAFFLRP